MTGKPQSQLETGNTDLGLGLSDPTDGSDAMSGGAFGQAVSAPMTPTPPPAHASTVQEGGSVPGSASVFFGGIDVDAETDTGEVSAPNKASRNKAVSGTAQLDTQVQPLGRIVCISGSQVVVTLSLDGENKPLGKLRKGSLVKLFSDTGTIYGIVTSLTIPAPAQDDAAREIMLAELDLVGETNSQTPAEESRFRRGVSTHPSLNAPIFLATPKDLDLVFSSDGSAKLCIGTLHEDSSRQAWVAADTLLGNHFAILGTTGSGKSCGTTVVLREMINQHANAHVLLLDPHNEYSTAFGDKAEAIHPNDLEIPYWLLNSEEIAEVIVGPKKDSEVGDQVAAILVDLITQSRRSYAKNNMKAGEAIAEANITVDTPVPYAMRDMLRLIDAVMGRTDRKDELGPYRWLKGRLETLRGDSRYHFMFGGVTVKDNMAAILSRLFRIPVKEKPLTIVDLSGVPSEVLNVVVSVLARMTFDFGLWSQGKHPILLVCEEAHRYAPADDGLGFEPTKQALARIAKEGRKYGVAMGIISQRPAEIAPVILSQCNTLFAFRMNSARDQEIVRGTLADSAHGLLDFLPALANTEAIVVGEGVAIPQRVRISQLAPDEKPRSSTARFSQEWSVDTGDESEIDKVVDSWRRQVR